MDAESIEVHLAQGHVDCVQDPHCSVTDTAWQEAYDRSLLGHVPRHVGPCCLRSLFSLTTAITMAAHPTGYGDRDDALRHTGSSR